MNLVLENYNKFISLIARRINKSEWHTFPERTKKVFYNHKTIEQWLVNASIEDKMFFTEDLGFTSAIVVFPNGKSSISDIPELSQYFFKIENRIKSVEKQLEKELFCICTRELAVYFYNMSQNSNSAFFALKQNFQALQESNKNLTPQKFSSATKYAQSEKLRNEMLKFVSNILSEFTNTSDLLLQHKIILLSFREYNQIGVKPNTIVNWFKGSVGLRQIYNYLSFLVKEGYVSRSGKTIDAIYMLSSKGMLYINDYCDRVLSL